MSRFTTTVMHLSNGALKQRYVSGDLFSYNGAQTSTFIKLLNGPYQKTLDVGCGGGYFSYVGAVNRQFSECYGCDIKNIYQVKELKEVAKTAEYRSIRKSTFPYPNNFFDLVFSMDVVEHVDEDIKFIKEKIRVCKSGGEIIFGTPNYWRPANIALLSVGRLKFPYGQGDCIHVREYSMKQLAAQVLAASEGMLNPKSLQIIPCWFGILPLNFGTNHIPKALNPFCHFIFLKFKKNW